LNQFFSNYTLYKWNNGSGGIIKFCNFDDHNNDTCKPIIRICSDEDEFQTDILFNKIIPIEVFFLLISLMASLCLQYFGNYSSMYKLYKWCNFCTTIFPNIVHFSVLHDSILKNNYTFNDEFLIDSKSFKNVINQKDQLYGQTALHVALENIKEDLSDNLFVNFLKQNQSDINFSIRDNFGVSLKTLTEAYHNRITDTVTKDDLSKLKDKNDGVHQKIDKVWRKKQPIFSAVEEKDFFKINLYNKLGVNWFTMNEDGESAINLLLQTMEIDEKLRKTQMKILYNLNKETVLFISSKNNYPNFMEAILNDKYENDVNVKNKYTGKTSLHIAVEFGNLECVRVLIKNKANVDEKNFEKLTPLHTAVESNDGYQISKLLILKRANVNAKDKKTTSFSNGI